MSKAIVVEQLEIPTMEAPKATAALAGRNTTPRKCNHCKNEYNALTLRSQFCSDSCRKKHFNAKVMNTEIVEEEKPNPKEKKSKPNGMAAMASLNGAPAHYQIAIDLLREEKKRWQDMYSEERTARKKAEDENVRLIKVHTEERHAAALQGVEDAQPSGVEKFLSGLQNLPAPIVEQFAPIIGRIAGMLLPPENANVVGSSVNGQLDEGQTQLINWINGMPELTQRNFLSILSILNTYDEQKLNVTLTQMINFLNKGTTIQSNVNVGMYGN
jgi:hypothetical protein